MDGKSKLGVMISEFNNIQPYEEGAALKRKRVNFDPEGSKFGPRADSLALQMATKHEAYPSTRKLTEFRETITIDSASSRRKFNLQMFRVYYTSDEYDCLPADAQEYHNVDEMSPFGKRISFGECSDNRIFGFDHCLQSNYL
jgi:hypothetical protein